jgi:hypothetical protein
VERNGESGPNATGNGFKPEIAGKVGQVGRNVCLEAGKEMVEPEQDQPILCSWRLSSARPELVLLRYCSSCRVLRDIPSVTASQPMKMPAASLRFSRAWPQPGRSKDLQSALDGLMYRRASVSAGGAGGRGG